MCKLEGSRRCLLISLLLTVVSSTAAGAQGPVAWSKAVETLEDVAVEVTVEDPVFDSKALEVKIVDPRPTRGTATLRVAAPKGGPVILAYQPNPNESGEDFVEFTVAGGAPAVLLEGKLTITIEPVNDPPEAIASSLTGEEDNLIEIKVGAQDPENDPLDYVLTQEPVHGELVEGALPTVKYKPEPNYVGPDSIAFKVKEKQEGGLESSPAVVKIDVISAQKGSGDGAGTLGPSQQDLERIRESAPGQYDPKEVRRTTTCSLEKCEPPAVYISGAEASTVEVLLPQGVTRVMVTAGEKWEEAELNVHEITFDEGCQPRELIHIDLIAFRRFKRSFIWSTPEQEKELLRTESDGCPPSLSLLLSGRRERLHVNIFWEDRETGRLGTITLPVALLYQRWWLEVNGFYALRGPVDERLVTRTTQVDQTDAEGTVTMVPMTRVLAKRKPNQTTDTGVLLNFYPGNYPWLGWAFGFSTQEDRAPSYYLGAGLRGMELGRSAVFSFSLGAVATPVRTFPGIDVGLFDPDDPRLDGEIEYTVGPFVSINLGFAIESRGPGK